MQSGKTWKLTADEFAALTLGTRRDVMVRRNPDLFINTNFIEAREVRENGKKQVGEHPSPDQYAGPVEADEPNPVDDKPFICEVCGKACKTKLALAGHMRSHKTDAVETS